MAAKLEPVLAAARAAGGPDLEMLVRAFLSEYETRTAESYATHLRQWLTWAPANGVPVVAPRRKHVAAWMAEMRDDLGLQPGTINCKLSAVSGFYNAVADELNIANPTAGIRRPKVSQESTRSGLDLDELLRLLDVAAAAGPAEHALVLLLGLNGLRISEALAIRGRDLGVERGATVVEITRKGGKKARPPLATETADAVHTLIVARGISHAVPVLPYRDRHQAKRRLVALVKEAGITGKRITPHSLRHTFVTQGLLAGVPLHLMQESAGHADPRTTQRYNREKDRIENHATFALADLVNQHHPA